MYVALLQGLSFGRLDLDTNPDYQGWKVDSLIAMVPDPVESGLGTQFDDYLDSIERAISDAGYEPDHFYNPWPWPNQLAKQTTDEGSFATGYEKADIKKIPSYELEPGLILFRDSKNSRLLVVFLVGETPTTGVHKGAFESALKQASEFPTSDSEAICPQGPGCEFRNKSTGPQFFRGRPPQ